LASFSDHAEQRPSGSCSTWLDTSAKELSMSRTVTMTAPARSGDELCTDADPLELTILMPCLNEAETLAACIRKASAFLAKHAIAGEVVVADNGSTDGSQEIARSCGARVVNVPRRGYGSALHLTEKLCRALTLEIGLVCGTLLFLLGLGGSIAAVFLWENASFGDLDPLRMMRVIIPAGLGMCLGCQIVLSSFFLGFLRMGRRL